jgi:hypothetical protein
VPTANSQFLAIEAVGYIPPGLLVFTILTIVLYPQHPPAKTCCCREAFQQRSQSSTVEWVIPSMQAIRRWTSTPQSEQAAPSGLSVLHSWVSMEQHFRVWTSAAIADG